MKANNRHNKHEVALRAIRAVFADPSRSIYARKMSLTTFADEISDMLKALTEAEALCAEEGGL